MVQTAELQKRIDARARSGSAADPRARAADRALDDAWGAFQSWLLGWTKLPPDVHARVGHARHVYAALFPKGLQFLTLDFKDEWTESQNRLERIQSDGWDILFAELGGKVFLEAIAMAHSTYGDALHITGRDVTPEPDALVRKSLDETHMCLRDYIAQIAAMCRRSESSSVDASMRLLAPLQQRDFYDDVTEVSAR